MVGLFFTACMFNITFCIYERASVAIPRKNVVMKELIEIPSGDISALL